MTAFSTRRLRIALWLCVACVACGGPPSAEERVEALGEIDFNFHVRPILAEHCFTCHGHHAESRKADLGLHVERGLFAPLRDDSSRFVVVPGAAARSELVRRITSPIAGERMPPPEMPRGLSEFEAEVLKQWIEQGAQWKPHWAFLPPERPEPPSTARTDGGRNSIDRFVLARLEREGLSPSEEADRRTLIRRLHLDLTGLPPSSEAVRRFLADSGDDAYARAVRELFASPQYGERMALHWLDLARYADTNGYSIDGGRHMWLWRDHHGRCFALWIAGGGVKPGFEYGKTDDFSYNIVENPVHIRDLNATLLHQLGIDHERLTVKFRGLDHKLTGVEEAHVVHGILA